MIRYNSILIKTLRSKSLDQNKFLKCNIHFTKSLNAVIPFKLADIGEGIAEVELMKWFIKVILYF